MVEEGSPKNTNNLRTGSTAVRDEIEKNRLRKEGGSEISEDMPNFGEQIYNPSFTFEASKNEQTKKQMELIVEDEDKSSKDSIQGRPPK